MSVYGYMSHAPFLETVQIHPADPPALSLPELCQGHLSYVLCSDLTETGMSEVTLRTQTGHLQLPQRAGAVGCAIKNLSEALFWWDNRFLFKRLIGSALFQSSSHVKECLIRSLLSRVCASCAGPTPTPGSHSVPVF